MAGDPPQATEVKYYLSCFPAPPLVLDCDSPTTIGRAEDNTIVLADSTVSRLHAVVEWKDGDFVLRDAGSRNGILLNGERVEEAPLRSDDQFRIGERVFTFISGEERAVTQVFLKRRRKRQSGGTEIIEASALARSTGGLAGNLKDFALADLLQALDLGRKTGCVAIVCEDMRGEMLLHEGRVVSCSFGGLEREDAAYALLSLGDGTFNFEARRVEVENGLTASTASLLMEALRRVDEERRARTEAADGAPTAEMECAEPHDPSLDTKHGEEPPPEVEAAEQGDTMVLRHPPPVAEDEAVTESAAPPEDSKDSPEDSKDSPEEEKDSPEEAAASPDTLDDADAPGGTGA